MITAMWRTQRTTAKVRTAAAYGAAFTSKRRKGSITFQLLLQEHAGERSVLCRPCHQSCWRACSAARLCMQLLHTPTAVAQHAELPPYCMHTTAAPMQAATTQCMWARSSSRGATWCSRSWAGATSALCGWCWTPPATPLQHSRCAAAAGQAAFLQACKTD